MLGTASYFGYKKVSEYIKERTHRYKNELDKVFLPDYNPNLLEKPKEYNLKYSYNEAEIKEKFERIKSNILKNRAVDAQIEINQVKLSNASANVKGKVGLLESFITQPDYALFKNIVNLDDVLTEQKSGHPLLYNNVFILWDGRIVNLAVNKEDIKFNLIIGDESKGIINAIIPVVFKKAVILKNNDKIRVFGRLNAESNNIFIEGLFAIKNVD